MKKIITLSIASLLTLSACTGSRVKAGLNLDTKEYSGTTIGLEAVDSHIEDAP